VNHTLWWVSAKLMALVSFIYLLKVVFYFEVVRRELHHPICVNFFFAPWITCLFLVKGLPCHLAVVGNFVGPLLDAKMGLR
jgi:hypothetical protein